MSRATIASTMAWAASIRALAPGDSARVAPGAAIAATACQVSG